MIKALLYFEGTFRYREAENYGCAGRGLFNPFSRTIGKQVDEADRDIFKWKKCVQCANGFNSLPEYKFWVNNATCSKFQLQDIYFGTILTHPRSMIALIIP